MSDVSPSPAGEAWSELIRLPAMDAFAAAFTPDVVLVASVMNSPITGPMAVRHFFDATRAMYDSIAFVRETGGGARTFLEWHGSFGGRPIEGVTILCRNDLGLIERILLFHSPREQVSDFSVELERRLKGAIVPSPFSSVDQKLGGSRQI